MCGGGGYHAPKAAAVPEESDEEVQAALERERELARKRKGRRSTILTSPTGLGDETTTKTLLGS